MAVLVNRSWGDGESLATGADADGFRVRAVVKMGRLESGDGRLETRQRGGVSLRLMPDLEDELNLSRENEAGGCGDGDNGDGDGLGGRIGSGRI